MKENRSDSQSSETEQEEWELHRAHSCWRNTERGMVYCNVTDQDTSVWRDPTTLELWSYNNTSGSWQWGADGYEEYAVVAGSVPHNVWKASNAEDKHSSWM